MRMLGMWFSGFGFKPQICSFALMFCIFIVCLGGFFTCANVMVNTFH